MNAIRERLTALFAGKPAALAAALSELLTAERYAPYRAGIRELLPLFDELTALEVWAAHRGALWA